MPPSSPLFNGEYEMQTDFTNDVSRNQTTMGRQQPKRKRINKNEALDRETSMCMVACTGSNGKCTIF